MLKVDYKRKEWNILEQVKSIGILIKMKVTGKSSSEDAECSSTCEHQDVDLNWQELKMIIT